MGKSRLSKLHRQSCLGCEKKLRRNDEYLTIRQTDDAGLTTQYSLCSACAGRVTSDDLFSKRLDQMVAQLPGSISA